MERGGEGGSEGCVHYASCEPSLRESADPTHDHMRMYVFTPCK